MIRALAVDYDTQKVRGEEWSDEDITFRDGEVLYTRAITLTNGQRLKIDENGLHLILPDGTEPNAYISWDEVVQYFSDTYAN